jgi:hypothetical protein
VPPHVKGGNMVVLTSLRTTQNECHPLENSGRKANLQAVALANIPFQVALTLNIFI